MNHQRTLYTWNDKLPMRRTLPYDVVFVFASNQRGRHGAGAALYAVSYFGAQEGFGEGFMGQSYGIPTKDHQIKTRPLEDIVPAIERFMDFARLHRRLKFFLTPVGCGRAGYTDAQVAPLFHRLSSNCAIPLSWSEYFSGFQFLESGV